MQCQGAVQARDAKVGLQVTRYSDHSGGVDGVLFFEYVCDLCSKTIQLAEGEDLPNGWLWVGIESDSGSTGHVCPSCRYFGAVDDPVKIKVRTVREQLKQTGTVASRILTFKDTDPKLRHAAKMVLIDLSLCVEKLKQVSVTLDEVGA